MRLFPSDESAKDVRGQTSFVELLPKQLRPELVVSNNKNEPAGEFDYFTWRQPTKCDECQAVIMDFAYYYFEKRSVDK